MTGKEPHPRQSGFDSLIAEMPRIAEAIKGLPEHLQPKAFEALIAQLSGREHASKGSDADSPSEGRRPRQAGQKQDRKPTRRAGSPSAVRDLDLAPKGKTSISDFAAKKQPKTNHDKNVVSVYYLSEILGLKSVTLDHVFTCYKDMRWREPGDMANSLSLTASRKRFIDTTNLDDIKLTPAGRNRVEQDLPREEGSRSS